MALDGGNGRDRPAMFSALEMSRPILVPLRLNTRGSNETNVRNSSFECHLLGNCQLEGGVRRIDRPANIWFNAKPAKFKKNMPGIASSAQAHANTEAAEAFDLTLNGLAKEFYVLLNSRTAIRVGRFHAKR